MGSYFETCIRNCVQYLDEIGKKTLKKGGNKIIGQKKKKNENVNILLSFPLHFRQH